jgi:hypothetical protein
MIIPAPLYDIITIHVPALDAMIPKDGADGAVTVTICADLSYTLQVEMWGTCIATVTENSTLTKDLDAIALSGESPARELSPLLDKLNNYIVANLLPKHISG